MRSRKKRGIDAGEPDTKRTAWLRGILSCLESALSESLTPRIGLGSPIPVSSCKQMSRPSLGLAAGYSTCSQLSMSISLKSMPCSDLDRLAVTKIPCITCPGGMWLAWNSDEELLLTVRLRCRHQHQLQTHKQSDLEAQRQTGNGYVRHSHYGFRSFTTQRSFMTCLQCCGSCLVWKSCTP